LQEQLDDTDVNILLEEITKMVALGQSHYSNVRHYGVTMATSFTPSNQPHLLEARFYEPTDLAAISALN
jgi:hypothetical protein